MTSPLTLARVWRILKEVDLDAIRREADRQVRLLIVGETTAEADMFAVLLAEGLTEAIMWLTAIDASLAGPPGGQREAPVVDGPDIVFILARGTGMSAELRTAREMWLKRGVRLVTVAVGTDERPGKVHTQGSAARVAVDRLDAQGVGHAVDALLTVVEPERRLALAREFPLLRRKIVDALIDETARTNAGYAFSTGLAEVVPLLNIPLNIGDVIVLTKNQLMMSYRIALASGKRGQARDLIGEIIGVLGGGLLFRQIARQLVGLLPVIGIVPKVAVAYGGTWAIGRAVLLWATQGDKLTTARLRELSREGLTRGRAVARRMKRSDDYF
ncbi:MAG TPA: hypothetical protein VGK32_11310 [Vicinamibacterales bacterium]|jgi:uncharacterized protein (DUF697 family)